MKQVSHVDRSLLVPKTSMRELMGVYVLQRLDADGAIAHFEILTLWDSLDAIKTFAGDEYERARYYPADDDFLLEREPHVEPLDVLLAKSGPAT